MVGIVHEIDWYSTLEEKLGHPPQYFVKTDPERHDGSDAGLMIGYHLEIERSVRIVSQGFFGMSHKRIRKECLSVGFRFDELIEDDIRSGLSHREIKKLHMMGGARIKEIAERIDVIRRPRNFLKTYSDEHIENVYRQNMHNAAKTAELLGIWRTTVSDAVARLDAGNPHKH